MSQKIPRTKMVSATNKKPEDIDWKNLHVLIVDDQEEARAVLKDMLAELEVTSVLEAKDGTEALKLADANNKNLSVIICDWNMPTMTGIELLKQFRGAMLTHPFLMATGRNDAGSVRSAKKAGVTGYILKPFSCDELREKITLAITTPRGA